MAHQQDDMQQREMAQLRAQNKELMHINGEWDKEYREQREAFRRYQADAQQAQTENHAVITRLKDKIASMEEERDHLEDELTRYQRELHALRERLAVVESLKTSNGSGCDVGGDMMGAQEELSLLRQQLKAYEEDFEAEKRDKERLRDEKQSAAIRYEAEKTSLQLRLDRCQADLAHFTSEANRLAQQLKLKNQYEEDKYRKHLESQGFVSRSPGSGLPPLDPYVEIDQNIPTLPPRHGRKQFAQNGSREIANQTLPNCNSNRLTVSSIERSMSPVQRRITAPLSSGNTNSWRLVPRGVDKKEDGEGGKMFSAPTKINSDGVSSDSSSSCDDGSFVDVELSEGVAPLQPPLSSRGKHVCPRCARRFKETTSFQQHKDRCLV